jgi:hypothetical protein
MSIEDNLWLYKGNLNQTMEKSIRNIAKGLGFNCHFSPA